MSTALDKIPESRRGAVIAAHKIARDAFEEWAVLDAPHLPAHEIDSMQVRLARWQVDRFGGPPVDALMALGIVEELGETADAAVEGAETVDGGGEQAVDGLGDVMVYAAQICTANRLAIRPILDLARVYTRHTDTGHRPIMTAAGVLAHVVLKHTQAIRGLGDPTIYRVRLVDAIALCIGKAIDEVEIGHNLDVAAPGVLLQVGKEILERKQGDAMIPAPTVTVSIAAHVQTPNVPDGMARAMAMLGDGVDSLSGFDVTDVITHKLCPQCAGLLSEGGASDVWRCENGHDITGKQLAAASQR